MRILSLYYSDKPGGFCKRLYRLLNALAERGHSVVYLTLTPPVQGTISERVKIQKIPFPLSQRDGYLFWILFILWCPAYTLYSALHIHAEKIMVFGAFYSTMGALASWISKAPIVLFVRSLVFKTNVLVGRTLPERIISNTIDRCGIFAAKKILVLSEAMKKEFLSFTAAPPEKFQVLPNDIPSLNLEPHQLAYESAPLRILTAGTLDKGKNIELLLRAIKIASNDLPPGSIHLTIAGKGALEAGLSKMAASLGLTEITFAGWVPSLHPLFETSHVLIHPSLSEGAPNSVLEALSFGVPTLVSSTDELWEILPSKLLTFDPVHPEDLADRLVKIVKKTISLRALHQECEKYSSRLKFDWNLRAVEYIEAS